MFKRMALLDLTPGISRFLNDLVDWQGHLLAWRQGRLSGMPILARPYCAHHTISLLLAELGEETGTFQQGRCLLSDENRFRLNA